LNKQSGLTRIVLGKPLEVVLGILAIAGFTLVHSLPISLPPIRSDGVGYYAYLPATFIDRDLTMNRLNERAFAGKIPKWTGIQLQQETHRYLDKYPIGVALMQLPFFLAAHGIALITPARADGFSAPYQIANGVSAVFYFTLAIGILRRLLAGLFEPRVVTLTLVVIAFGTNLYHYATFDATFSHVYSFALFCAFIALTRRLCDGPPQVGRSIAWGAVLGLIGLVRVPNLHIAAFAATYALLQQRELKWWTARWLPVAAGLFACLVVFSPQILYWHYVTGHWFPNSYPGETFNWTSPQVLNVLFSAKKGLFFWAPVLLLAVLGWRHLRRRTPALAWAIAVSIALQVYVTSSWWSWSYGGSFGHRGFTEFSAFTAFALGAWFEKGLSSEPRRTYKLAAVLSAYSVVMMLLYWVNVIPRGGFEWGTF
jgi:hypothetical protein